jgi:hypothetical protein
MDKLLLSPNTIVVNKHTEIEGVVVAAYQRNDIYYLDVRTNFCIHWESPLSKWEVVDKNIN